MPVQLFEQFALVEMPAKIVLSVVPDLRAYLGEYADCIVDPAWHGLATDFDEKSGEFRAQIDLLRRGLATVGKANRWTAVDGWHGNFLSKVCLASIAERAWRWNCRCRMGSMPAAQRSSAG